MGSHRPVPGRCHGKHLIGNAEGVYQPAQFRLRNRLLVNRHTHQQMADVYNKSGKDNFHRAGPQCQQPEGHKLRGPGKHQQAHPHGVGQTDAGVLGQQSEGKGNRHIPDSNAHPGADTLKKTGQCRLPGRLMLHFQNHQYSTSLCTGTYSRDQYL